MNMHNFAMLAEQERDMMKQMDMDPDPYKWQKLALSMANLPPTRDVMFSVEMVPNPGDEMRLVGDHPDLGMWCLEAGVDLHMLDEYGPIWRGAVTFPLYDGDVEISFKFVRIRNRGRVEEWERGADRRFVVRNGSRENPPTYVFNDNGPGPSCPKPLADDAPDRVHSSPLPPPVVTAEVCVEVTCSKTNPGDSLRLVGSKGEIGSWVAAEGVTLTTTPQTFPLWTANLTLPLNENVEWKLVIVHPDASMTWETGSNRSIRLNSSALGNQWIVHTVFDSTDTRINQVPLVRPGEAKGTGKGGKGKVGKSSSYWGGHGYGGYGSYSNYPGYPTSGASRSSGSSGSYGGSLAQGTAAVPPRGNQGRIGGEMTPLEPEAGPSYLPFRKLVRINPARPELPRQT